MNPSFSQEMVFNSQPKLMHVSNPSYFGLNSSNRSGLLYNTTETNPNETQNNKFFYGSYSFDLLDFSLGVQFNNFNAPSVGFKKNDFFFFLYGSTIYRWQTHHCNWMVFRMGNVILFYIWFKSFFT